MEDYKYLYINNFEWTDEGMMDDFGDNPKDGGVYKAKNESLFYKINIDSSNPESAGVAIQKRELVNDGEDSAWICDIELVSAENLFTLDISEQDLSMMANDKDSPEEIGQDNLNKTLMSQMKDSLLTLKDFDVEMFEALSRVTTLMAMSITDSPYITLTDGLTWHPHTAKVSAVSLAVGHLERYLNSDDDTNDVLEALFVMITEMMRQHKMHRNDVEL